jgi:hypothetical protein
VSLFGQLRDYGQRYGFARTASRLASESLKQTGLFRHSVFVLLRPEDVDRKAYDAALPYERRLVPAQDMAALASQLPADLPPTFLEDARRRGDSCYVILDRGELVSFGWYAPRIGRLFERDFSFDEGWVYMYHGFTLPKYRGQRLHAMGLAEALHAFCQRGKRGIISTVNSTNYASLISIERLGFVTAGSLVQIGRGKLSARLASPATRPYAIRFRAT